MAVLERRQGMKPLCWELVLSPLLLGQPFRPTAPWAELERGTARAQTGGLGRGQAAGSHCTRLQVQLQLLVTSVGPWLLPL